MKLLVLSNNLARPSFRQRIEIYLPRLQDAGVETSVCQFPKSKLQRWALLKSARFYDAVLIHKKCLNWIDSQRLRHYARRMIYDFDDAIMYSPYRPDSNHSSHMRLFKRTASIADCMIAGNAYLADQAHRICSRIQLLPTGLDTRVYTQTPPQKDNGLLRLAWVGSGKTLPYLAELKPVFETIGKQPNDTALRIIADDFFELNSLPVEKCPWSLETQIPDLLACDIGLAPLPDNRFTRGKCGFKILQYFAAGLPVIASPVGVNRDLIEQSGAGVLAATAEEWKEAIEQLMNCPERRETMGQKAKEYVKQFDTGVLAEKFCHIILSELERG